MGADGVADAVGDKGLLPRTLQLHQPAAHLGGTPGAQRLVQGVLLVAETAANVGFDDPDLAPGQSQRLPHHPADDVGNLSGTDHHDPPRLLIGKATVVFDMTVLDGGGVVPALDFNKSRLLPGLLIVAIADAGVLDDIVRELLMNLGSAVLHGFLHIQHKGQFLILHLQGADTLGRRHLVLRDDHRHIISVITDMTVQQHAVRDVLVARVRRPGMARRREWDIGNVEAGQDPHHTGYGLRLRDVDGLYKPVGDGGMENFGHQGAAVAQIVHILGPAGGLFIGVHPGHAFSDAFAHRTALLQEWGFTPD